jgi:hypothetical protein
MKEGGKSMLYLHRTGGVAVWKSSCQFWNHKKEDGFTPPIYLAGIWGYFIKREHLN